MALFKSNRDMDSTIIVVGIHLLLGGVLALEYLGGKTVIFHRH